jgi:benzoate/toluate 1,2-dioxygenase beta subunit
MNADYPSVAAFLYREARLLDDRCWDEWLGCYARSAVFWMPAWDDDDALTQDPQSQLSLIYYPNRDGLEDRVFRIKTERSGASLPEPRTSHNITNIELGRLEGPSLPVRFNWFTLSHRYKTTQTFFGTSFYVLDVSLDEPTIVSKKVVLKDDYIHQVIDIYHI